MKARFILITFLLFFLSGLNAQTGFFGGSVVPLKPQSPLFGKDIVINDQPTQDQYKVALCSAFNGWQYAVIAYGGSAVRLTFLKSVDGGINWTIIMDGWVGSANTELSSMDILVSGDSVSNLKIIFSSVIIAQNDPSLIGDGDVSIFNEASGIYEYTLLHVNSCYDLAIASDYLYPAVNSNPHSIGILYSIYRIYGDSILFSSSSNGGLTLDGYRGVAGTTTNHFHKVALTYGRSQSFNSGKYFAVWEEQNGFGEMLGHIYTAHTNPNFNSPFTTPIQLDALDPSDLNMCRNPVIACQYNNTDNDSANLTEVVLFEKFKPASGDYDVTGYYNLQAATTSHFRPLTIAAASNNELQPDICFNTYNSKFMVTYFDSTDKKLPFLTNNVNLANPNSWNVVSQGYNDNSNLVAPYPKVELNFAQQDGINAWISEGTGGNGIALFDAPYSTYTGVSGHGPGTSAELIGSYPNPCNNSINIAFELKNAEMVTINVIGILSQPLGTITDQAYPAGKHVVKYDVSDLPNGNYLYEFRSGDFNAMGKFTVIR